jgi:Family of unknown function (DUF6000)
VDRRPFAGKTLIMRATLAEHRKLLHGNFQLMLPPPERATFLQRLVEDAEKITDDELGGLLDGDWRSRITAAWLAGANRRGQFRERVGELLLASQLVFAGQGYCFALARFGTTADAEILTAYLTRYLPQLSLSYDQAWAMGALQYLDARLDTYYAAEFTWPGGLWEQWATPDRAGLLGSKERFGTLCALVEEAVRASRGT